MGRPRSALFDAAMAGNRDRLRGLLKEPDGSDFADETRAADAARALSVAARYGDAGLIEELAAAGAPMDSPSQDHSALIEALASDHAGDDAIKALIKGGADVNRQAHDGVSPVSTAAWKGNASAMRLLIEAGAVVNTIGAFGEPVLMIALHRAGEETAKALLEAGAWVNTRNQKGVSPLMKAASMGRMPLVSALIKAGAEVNARDADGSSALHHAAFHWNLECAQALVAAGSDPEAKNHKGEDMLDLIGTMNAGTPAREQFKLWAEGLIHSARERRELTNAVTARESAQAGEPVKRARP